MTKDSALLLYKELVRSSPEFTKLLQQAIITFPLHREIFSEYEGIRLIAREAAGNAFIEFGKALRQRKKLETI